MADTQIRGLGESPAPLVYTVPGAQEIILKSLFASFDGTSAGSAWFPCVRIRAPGGGIVGEYITQASVAAGASADVSFAPFLRGASASVTPTAAAMPTARTFSQLSQTVAAGGDLLAFPNTNFGTTDPTIFDTAHSAPGDVIKIFQPGLYMAWLRVEPVTNGSFDTDKHQCGIYFTESPSGSLPFAGDGSPAVTIYGGAASGLNTNGTFNTTQVDSLDAQAYAYFTLDTGGGGDTGNVGGWLFDQSASVVAQNRSLLVVQLASLSAAEIEADFVSGP